MLLLISVAAPFAFRSAAEAQTFEPSCDARAGLVPDEEGTPFPYTVYGSGSGRSYSAFRNEPLVITAFTYAKGTYNPQAVTVNWGDGTTSPASVVLDCHAYLPGEANQTGNFFYGQHTYTADGSYRVKFSIFGDITTFNVTARAPEPVPTTPPPTNPPTPSPTPTPTNKAPVVNAGTDRTVSGTDRVDLHGTVTDDGRPAPSRLTYSWSKVSGPGTLTFGSAASIATSVAFSAPGTYVLRLAASDGQLKGEDLIQLVVRDHYRVEIRAWIPHPAVVDPVHQLPEALGVNSVDSMSACGTVPGPLVQTSTFRGDNHRNFSDGSGTYRGRSYAEFDWDGVRISNFVTTKDPAALFGVTHRDFVLDRNGTKRTCTRSQRATSSSIATTDGTKGLRLDLRTSNPLVQILPGVVPAPPIDSDLSLQFTGPNAMTIQTAADEFPNHGFQLWRNGNIFYTRALNQAACVNALGPAGATNLLTRLTSQTNTGSWSVNTRSAPATYNRTCT